MTAEERVTNAPWFQGSRALVVGLARSGCSAAKLLMRHGANVRGIDRRRAEELGDVVGELTSLGVELSFGWSGPEPLADRDLVVVSHGAVMIAAQWHVTGSWPPAGRHGMHAPAQG